MAATIHIHHRHLLLLLSPKADTHFTIPWRRLSRPRHCRKGAQPVPKAVHRSGCRDKHKWPQPLTPQSIMPLPNHCDLQGRVGVNNLPKVVTRQRRGRELNSQPSSCKSNDLTTKLPSHQRRQHCVYTVTRQSNIQCKTSYFSQRNQC